MSNIYFTWFLGLTLRLLSFDNMLHDTDKQTFRYMELQVCTNANPQRANPTKPG